MSTGVRRTLALLLALFALLGGMSGAAYAQADKPDVATPLKANPDSPDAIALPDSGSTSTSGIAWSITNIGTGRVGYFNLNNTNTDSPALEGRTYSASPAAVGLFGLIASTGGGVSAAGVRGVNNSTTGRGYGVLAQHMGAGSGLFASAAAAGGRGVAAISYGTTGTGKGVYGESRSPGGDGGYFVNTTTTGTGKGVYGRGPDAGVWGQSASKGVYGNGVTGVYGDGSNIGVFGEAPVYGVYGRGTTAVFGEGTNYGVYALSTASNSSAVYGYSGASNSKGVSGNGTDAGVWGQSASKGVYGNGVTGIYGDGSNIGVYGEGVTGVYGKGSIFGVRGFGGDYGVYGKGVTWAGYFEGNVKILGTCTGCAGSTARIDHPLDADKYIEQADVLASERLGIANGNVSLDAKGEAIVTLPAWFEGIYADYRYNLTPIGGFAPLYVADKVKGNSFKIAGGKAGMEVSWQVSGVRQDKYAKENPLQTEGLKSDDPKPVAPPEVKQTAAAPEGVEAPAEQ